MCVCVYDYMCECPLKMPVTPIFVPVSTDLRVSGCYGLFVPGPSPGQVAMATLDWWTTLAVELAHTRALDETRGVAIQVGSCSSSFFKPATFSIFMQSPSGDGDLIELLPSFQNIFKEFCT